MLEVLKIIAAIAVTVFMGIFALAAIGEAYKEKLFRKKHQGELKNVQV